MAAKDRINKAGEAARAAQRNQYLQRLLEDEELRGQPAHRVRRSAQRVRADEQRQARHARRCSRIASSSASCREAASALRDASSSLREPPKRAAATAASDARCCCSRVARRARDRAQRGPALEGARPAVRRRGGVRLQLDHRSGGAAPRRAGGLAHESARKDERSGRSRWRPTPRSADRGRRLGESRRRRAAGARSRARRRSGSSRRCAAASRGAAPPARPSTTSRARPASRAGCCTTTSAPRSSCSSRPCGATASCVWSCSSTSSPTAQTADDFIDLMAQNLQETVREDPDFVTLVFELFTLSRRNEDIAAEYAGLMRRTREQVARDARRSRSARASCICTPSPRRSPRCSSRSATGSRCACSPSPSATSRATVQAGIVAVRALLTD